jgi:hypothetical protein
MLKPCLIAETSADYPGKVLCSASFVPTFSPVNPQEEIEIEEDE